MALQVFQSHSCRHANSTTGRSGCGQAPGLLEAASAANCGGTSPAPEGGLDTIGPMDLVDRAGWGTLQTGVPAGKEALHVVLPSALRLEVLTQVHQQHGHQGIDRTSELFRLCCYRPSMFQEEVRWCQQCKRCQLTKDIQPVIHSFMDHLPAAWPNKTLAIDFTVLEPSVSSHKSIIVMTEVFTKYTMAELTRDQCAPTVTRVLLGEWFCKFDLPGRFHFDQGRSFESSLNQQLCCLFRSLPSRVPKSHTTPYHPTGNGQGKCFNRTLHNLLRTLPGSIKTELGIMSTTSPVLVQ